MSTRISPTVHRRRLAMELRRLRTEAGIKADEVARELACSPGKISQMETGRVSITVSDTKAMLELYGVTGERRDELLELARTAKQRGWWHPYGDALYPWARHYIGLETGVSAIRGYRTTLVPDLLQTEDYQRAALARDSRVSDTELDRLVELGRRRRELLDGPDAPQLWFVLDETVLRRRVGSAQVMRAQLDHLLEAGHRPNITVQVLPYAAGALPATTGSFTLLEFPDLADPAVVHIRYVTGALYLQNDEDVQVYRGLLDDLTANALSKTRSAALIKEAATDL